MQSILFGSIGNYEYVDEIKLIIKASVNNFFPMIFANSTSFTICLSHHYHSSPHPFGSEE